MERYLDICAKTEEAVGTIYRGLAENLPDDREGLRRTLRQMAEDEEDHAKRVRRAAMNLGEEAARMRGLPRSRVELLLLRSHMILMGMNDAVFPAGDALVLGLRLEEEFREIHSASAALAASTDVGAMFEGLACEDGHHLSLLRDLRDSVPGIEGQT